MTKRSMPCEAEIPDGAGRTRPCSRNARDGYRTCGQHANHEIGIMRRRVNRCIESAAAARHRGDSSAARRMAARARALANRIGDPDPTRYL